MLAAYYGLKLGREVNVLQPSRNLHRNLYHPAANTLEKNWKVLQRQSTATATPLPCFVV